MSKAGQKLTYFEYERGGIDTTLLKKEEPDLAEKYAKVTKYRSIKFPKK